LKAVGRDARVNLPNLYPKENRMSTSTEIEHVELKRLAEEIAVEVQAMEEGWHQTLSHAITAGQKLTEAKSLVNHGQWLPWLEEHFPGHPKTATNYMRLAANRSRVADLPTVRDALDALAKPNQKKLPSGEKVKAEPFVMSAEQIARTDAAHAKYDAEHGKGAWQVATRRCLNATVRCYIECEPELDDDIKAALGPVMMKMASHLLAYPEAEVLKTPTEAEVDAARTGKGWTRAQLAKWGVPWPVPKGWKTSLLEGSFDHLRA
jgi:hypothetical protein